MLHSAKTIERHELRARDGSIGHVRDLYLDDHSWHVRYLVVETGSWLTGRRVLIPPKAVTQVDWRERTMMIDLTQEQVRESPGIETDKPVSRQQEEALHLHYGWPLYGGGGGACGAAADPSTTGVGVFPPADYPLYPMPDRPEPKPEGNPHLRSVREIRGYGIEATDGSLGHLDDVLVDPKEWRIWYVVVDTRNWWPGKRVLVARSWITRVSWSERAIHVDLPRERIKGGPEYDPAREVSREYAERLHEYYGRPHLGPW